MQKKAIDNKELVLAREELKNEKVVMNLEKLERVMPVKEQIPTEAQKRRERYMKFSTP